MPEKGGYMYTGKKVKLPVVHYEMIKSAYEYLKMEPVEWVKIMCQRSDYKKWQESDYYYFIVGYVTPVLRDLLQVTERKD